MSDSKKSVGIITFQWFNNYGTVLQAYALQTALKRLGYAASIVPITCNHLSGWRRFLAKSLRGVLMKINLFLWERGNRRRNMYNAFRQQNFDYGPLSPLSFQQLMKRPLSYDALVWGSDNIWGPWCVRLDDAPMSGVFFGDGVAHVRKIAYAASTGAHLELHPEYREAISRVKSAGFERIGLREKANVKVFEANGVAATHVPDPSLLLAAKDWAAVEERDMCPARPYVLGYELGHIGSLTVRQGCAVVAAAGGLDIRMPYPQAYWRDRSVACYPNPLQWVALFHHAQCVVTDSFHGVMFSLIFKRPFVFIPAQDESGIPNMRVNEMLGYVGLESRILPESADTEALKSLMEEPIDWPSVGRKLEAFRNQGVEYLKQI